MAENGVPPAPQAYSPIYQPLTNPHASVHGRIRLLRILPGRTPETLRCELEVNDLDDAPPFEAISYVWGNPEPGRVVVCNEHAKKVTPNLGIALERLRYEYAERLVWIDAICVNQSDFMERSQQVKLMKEIYSQAWRVVVWLGEDEEDNAETTIRMIENAADYCYSDSGALLKDVDNLNSILRAFHLDFELPWSKEKQQRRFPGSRYEFDRTNNRDWKAVSKFYRNAWFTRIWIVQEVAFAPAIMYIGTHEVSWICVAAAAKWFLAKSYTYVVDDASRYRQAWLIYYLHLIKPTLPLSRLLGFVKSNATDPRDKVFALLSFLSEESRSSPYLQPDYTKSVTEVYTDAIRYIIQQNSPGDGLSNLWATFGEPSSEVDETFPSWLYRWDIPVPESCLFTGAHTEAWFAGGATTQEIKEIADQRIICLKGMKIGLVREVNNALHQYQRDLERVLFLWNSVLPTFTLSQDFDSLKQAFVETITAEGVKTSPESTAFGAQDLDNYLSIPDWKNIYEFLDERSESISNAMELLMSVHAKSFLTTEDQKMALGPIIAQPGDTLCIFFGHHMPYLLRPVRGRYRFLGPCYVHSHMHGEAVKRLNYGELKEEWFELQ